MVCEVVELGGVGEECVLEFASVGCDVGDDGVSCFDFFFEGVDGGLSLGELVGGGGECFFFVCDGLFCEVEEVA